MYFFIIPAKSNKFIYFIYTILDPRLLLYVPMITIKSIGKILVGTSINPYITSFLLQKGGYTLGVL